MAQSDVFRTFCKIEFRAILGGTGSSVNGGRVENYCYEKSGFKFWWPEKSPIQCWRQAHARTFFSCSWYVDLMIWIVLWGQETMTGKLRAVLQSVPINGSDGWISTGVGSGLLCGWSGRKLLCCNVLYLFSIDTQTVSFSTSKVLGCPCNTTSSWTQLDKSEWKFSFSPLHLFSAYV